VSKAKNNQKTVSLVLGSGGARGLAHIGIIRYLEEQGYQIKSVSGCSIGALVGGVYVAGKLDEFEHWVKAITTTRMVSMMDIAWSGAGLFKGDKIVDALREMVGEHIIEDLPIPYTAVAADIVGEKEVWLQSGCLFDAIRASISLPLFFTPFDFKGVPLIDGGVLNPVPIAPTFGDHTDLTIAVNLGGANEELGDTPVAIAEPEAEAPFYQEMIDSFIETLGMNGNADEPRGQLGANEIATQAFDAMQGSIARLKLAAYPPDVLIEIPRNLSSLLEFDRAAELIEFGYQRAQQQLPAG